MARTRTDSPPLPFNLPDRPDHAFEQGLLARGIRHVAGCDEAGRGPLCGPVVAAAVILDPTAIPEGINDSKAMTAAKREQIAAEIMQSALACCIVSLSAETIDRTNILRASLSAMARAVRGLSLQPDHVIVDGRDVPVGLPCPADALIKGDARAVSIAAASILAKVTRDRMLINADAVTPGYGLARHKGYGSQTHRDVIAREGGIVRMHRFTFAPLKDR
jgi:ribonuclease HII